MNYLIPPNKKQYKANLHCHSVLSDGKKTPDELKKMYKENGYSILAITDHERPVSHQSLNDDGFIMLTGYEAYIRPSQEGKYDTFAEEVHLNLFAKDPNNVGLICCNECYSKYLKRDNALENVTRIGSERPREFTTEYINEFIRTAKDNGYLVVYNHPYWSMQKEESILLYDGLFSLEICNYSSYRMNGLEYSGALYDKLLLANRRIFCHGADDNHNADADYTDSFGAFTMIMPEEFTYSSIVKAMEEGEMYASMGPVFHEIYVDGNKVHIECSEVESIYLYIGSKTPSYRHAKDGIGLTSADFEIKEGARYVRISIRDKFGRWADTRGFFPDELGLIK